MPRIKLVIAYVGTEFQGWQTQALPDGTERPTIQSAVARAVRRVTGTAVHVHGAGRTDSGVHAHAQVAHMDVPDDKAGVDWQLALNTGLPDSIRIVHADLVPDSFHAQHSAVRKTYLYRLWLDRRYVPPQIHPFVWGCGPLDEKRMHEAASHLIGEQDFAAMRNAGTKVESTVRTVHTVRLLPVIHPCLRTWCFEADGFLKQMVRNMAGLLVAAGQNRLEPHAVADIIQQGDRRHIGKTAPARGLTLHRVWYGDNMDETSDNTPPTSFLGDFFF